MCVNGLPEEEAVPHIVPDAVHPGNALSRINAYRTTMDAIPNAFDPGDKGPGIIAGNVIVAVLATIAVGLRVLSRHMQRLSLEADDYLIFVALVSTKASRVLARFAGALLMYWKIQPFGWAMCALPPHLLPTEGQVSTPTSPRCSSYLIPGNLQAFYASELIWAASIPIIKISILLLYIRIFGRLRYFKILAYIIGVFSICWAIMVILVCAFQCRPVQLVWDKSVSGTCINAPLFFIIGSAPNVFTDFVLLVLPLPAVWNLHTTRAQKISLTVIFLLGSL
ncbi:MAG: hypothetical protein Q9206_004612 [Seirophora lacunosa]